MVILSEEGSLGTMVILSEEGSLGTMVILSAAKDLFLYSPVAEIPRGACPERSEGPPLAQRTGRVPSLTLGMTARDDRNA